MGEIKKQGISSTLFSYIGVVIGFANVIFIQPRLLDAVDIGLLRLLLSAGSIVAMLMPLGIGSITMRFFPVVQNGNNRHHGHFSMMLLFTLVGCAVITGLLYLFKPAVIGFYIEKSPLIAEYFDLIWFLSFVLGLIAIFNILSASLYSSGITFFLNDVLVRVLTIAIVVMYYYKLYDRTGLVCAFLFIYVIQLTGLFIHLGRLKAIAFKVDWSFYRSLEWKRMILYGMIMLLTAVASLGIKFVDQIIMGHYLNLSSVGVYSICIFIVAIMEIPYNSLERITNAKMAEMWHRNDVTQIFKTYKDSVRYLSLTSILLFALIWTQTENIFSLMPPEFAIGKDAMRIIALAALMNSITGLNGSVLTTSRKYFIGALLLVILLVSAVVLNILLIPVFGITGAAWATFISVVLFNAMKYVYILYRYKMQPFDGKTIFLLLAGGGITFAISAVPYMHGFWLDSIVRGSLVVVPFGVLLWYLEPVNEVLSLKNKIKKLVYR